MHLQGFIKVLIKKLLRGTRLFCLGFDRQSIFLTEMGKVGKLILMFSI